MHNDDMKYHTAKSTFIRFPFSAEPLGRPTLRPVLILLLSFFSLARIGAAENAAPASQPEPTHGQPPAPLILRLEPGEKWWGGASFSGPAMPYSTQPFAHDLLGNNLGNQTVPLLLSQHGRYVWCEDPFKFEFKEFNEFSLTVTPHFSQPQTGKAGTTLKDAYLYASKTFFPPAGRTPDELMFLAPQYNTWIELIYNQNEADILKYAKGIRDHGFPPGVLMIDDNWQEDYGVWDFSARRFTHPKAMVDQLHRMGFKVMLWVSPFVSPDSAVYRELEEKHLFIQEKDKPRPAMIRWWNGVSAVLDLSNPEAVQWFKAQLQTLQDKYGVDGFKFDAGDDEFYLGDLVSQKPIHANAQSELYAQIGLAFPLNEYRACWKMGGQPLAQRLRDKSHTWEDLQTLVPGIIAQGLMGYAFTCPDLIGGGDDASFKNLKAVDQDLVARAAQCHALMPMMQFSMAPWRVLDARHLAICKNMAILHKTMGREILTLAQESSRTGEPIVRNMEYVFPGQGWEELKDQFMLGNNILVAPVLEKGAVKRFIQFPQGKWKGDDGSIVTGPGRVEVSAPLERLPWYRRVQ
jgi:alpha-glucosidase